VVLARASAFFKAIFESPMQDEEAASGVTPIFLDDVRTESNIAFFMDNRERMLQAG
jgi:hypothetical protein